LDLDTQSCVNLGKLLNFSVLPFLHLHDGDNNGICLIKSWKLLELIYEKALGKCRHGIRTSLIIDFIISPPSLPFFLSW
jgi:hypothetical protein